MHANPTALVCPFLLLLAGSAVHSPGQTTFFTEVWPVHTQDGGPFESFPALDAMSSAWGDFDADGDLDVILSGRGPIGPVTKLYVNQNPGAGQFAFVESPISASLPQLQNGAMAWGDPNKDGKLDLVMTGSVTATPSSLAEVRCVLLTNLGPDDQGVWRFNSAALPSPCHGGCVSWGDMDQDGDQDLFVSGIGGDRLWPLAETYQNVRGQLERVSSQRFWSVGATADAREGRRDPVTDPEEFDVYASRRCTWVDVNKDGLTDLILSFETQADLLGGQEVWMNRGGDDSAGRFQRLGDTAEGEAPLIVEGMLIPVEVPWPAPMYSSAVSRRIAGGAGDWDGDGWMDLAFIGFTERVKENPEQSDYGWVLHRTPAGAGADDLIPGFSTHVPDENSFLVTMQVSADVLNSGRQQWLGSVVDGLLTPYFRLLGNEGDSLSDLGQIHDLGLQARVGGVLDAVDADGDGRLDLLHSGYDGAGELKTVFYRKQIGGGNTPPAPPGGLAAEATPHWVRFRWDPATDAETPTAGLRYAIRLQDSQARQILLPGAMPDGTRLTPGLDGTLQTLDFYFDTYNSNFGQSLPEGTYSWSVQTVDSGGMGSPFATERQFTVRDEDAGSQVETGLSFRSDAALDLGDYDGNGTLDAVIAGTPLTRLSSTLIMRNAGNHFAAIHSLPALRQGAVRWGDVDGDGDLDLALSGDSDGQPITRLYRNEAGDFRMRDPNDHLHGVAQSALDWADVDNDGDLDLVVTGYADGQPRTRLYRNGGMTNGQPGTLFPQTTNLPDIGAGAVAWGDFDGDGDPDLLLCGDTQNYHQPPQPCVLPAGAALVPGFYTCHQTTGHPALPMTMLLRNDGLDSAGTWVFTGVDAVLPPTMSSFTISGGLAVTARAEWSDLNGDGRPDLLLGGVIGLAGQPGYAAPSVGYFRNDGPHPMDLGRWRFEPGRELLSGPIVRALQTMTCADWDSDGFADILLSGRLNSAGSVETQIIHNHGLAFIDRTHLKSRSFEGDRFVSGLAAFGHFNSDSQPDVLLSGMWGIRSGSTPPSQRAGVAVGASSLIGQLDYSDSFTVDSGINIRGRPLYPLRPTEASLWLESTHGHPAATFRIALEAGIASTIPYRFVTDNVEGGDRSLLETHDGFGLPSQYIYPGVLLIPGEAGGEIVIPNASGAGSHTGFLEIVDLGADYGTRIGLVGRDEYVVQVDAVQPPGHIRIASRPTLEPGFPDANSVSVLFADNGTVALRRGAMATVVPQMHSGITGPHRWYNYAVRFNRPGNLLEIFVNQVSRGTVALNEFANGNFRDFSTEFVSVGGSTPDLGTYGEPRLWTDNLQIGTYATLPVGPPARTWDEAGTLFFNPSENEANAPPAPPADLTASVQGTAITFSWQPTSDDHTPAPGLTYNLHVERVDGHPGGMPGMADLATGKRRICRTGNVGHRTIWTLHDLPAGQYRWAVQSLDAALAASGFAVAGQTFTVGSPLPPVIIAPPPLHEWTAIHPNLSAVNFTSIAAGRSARLVTGRSGQLFLSRRGGPFIRVNPRAFTDLFDVHIDVEGAIIVGEAGVIRTSTDGIFWTESPSNTSATLRTITRGGTGWVAAGDGIALHSTDRRAWAPGTMPANTLVRDVVWAKGRYVAAGERAQIGVLLTSTDGLTWTETTPPGQTRGSISAVASDGQKFLATGSDNGFFPRHNDLFSSVDGTAWTVTQTTDAQALTGIIHGTEGWFAIGNDGTELRRSADGNAWQPIYRDSFASLTAGAAEAGLLTVAGQNGILFDSPASADPLSSWTQRSGEVPSQAAYHRFRGLAAQADTIVAIGSAGLNYLSQDGGRSWMRKANGVIDSYFGIASGAGHFVRTFKQGIESSADGVSWEKAAVTETRALDFGNGRFVAARTTGGFMISTDGTTWSAASPTTPWCTAITFGNGRFLARESSTGRVHSSADGLTWTAHTHVSSFGVFCFARDRFFAMWSPDPDLFLPYVLSTSTDGVTWQPVAGFPASPVPTQIIWHLDRFVALGEISLTSTDLVVWSRLPIPAAALTAISTSAGLIVAGEGQSLLLAPYTTPTPPAVAPTIAITGNPSLGVITLSIAGRPGQAVILERSVDLATWITADSFSLASGEESFDVEIPNPQPAVWFRLRWMH